jgi:simple sugar transport system permease protein
MGDLQLLLQGTLVLAAPLILAAIGGFFSERSGVINIALEGKMLIATVTVWLVAIASGNAVIGVAAGVGAATLFSLLHWLLTQKFKVDPIVSGMAINAIAFGGANFLDKKFTNPDQSGFPKLPTYLYWGFALVLPFVVWVYVRRTRGGLRLLAVGSDPDKARQMGVFPHRIRWASLVATGVCCGLAGALIVTNVGSYTDNMTAGRGFIALAALIIGGWRPLPVLVACIGFGMFQQLQIQLQGSNLFGLDIPRELWLCLPYVVTIVALAGLLGKNRTPSGLGKP